MSIRKQGLAKVVAGLAIFMAFLQATALQSLTGGPTGFSNLFFTVGPFLCVAGAFIGLYELITARPLKTGWQAFQRQKLGVRCGLVVGAVLVISLLVHVLFTTFATSY